MHGLPRGHLVRGQRRRLHTVLGGYDRTLSWFGVVLLMLRRNVRALGVYRVR